MRLIRVALPLAVVATAATSALVTLHRESDADARDRATATSGLFVSVGTAPTFPLPQRPPHYLVPLRNDSSALVEVTSAGLVGAPSVSLHKLLQPGEVRLVRLPLGACPARRLGSGLDRVELVARSGGAEKRLTAVLEEPESARALLNTHCGLLSVNDAFGGGGLQALDVRRGRVRVEVSLGLRGTRRPDLLAVRGSRGVRVTVAEELPLSLPVSGERDVASPGTVLHVTLELQSCAEVERVEQQIRAGFVTSEPTNSPPTTPDPVFDELQLEVRMPGEPVERLNLRLATEAANTFAAACDVEQRYDEVG